MTNTRVCRFFELGGRIVNPLANGGIATVDVVIVVLVNVDRSIRQRYSPTKVVGSICLRYCESGGLSWCQLFFRKPFVIGRTIPFLLL